MNNSEKVAEIRFLQDKLDTIRKELEFNQRGQVLYHSPLDLCSNDIVVVEADGFGGATTSIVEGNYPLDYITKFEKTFLSESEAGSAAEKLVSHKE